MSGIYSLLNSSVIIGMLSFYKVEKTPVKYIMLQGPKDLTKPACTLNHNGKKQNKTKKQTNKQKTCKTGFAKFYTQDRRNKQPFFFLYI